ncbi:hypothetical protein FRB99_006748 [Tulasnella sp. 403]|nr:hypothetical protein FRB99_006748 [Tulasnella sp. 403]
MENPLMDEIERLVLNSTTTPTGPPSKRHRLRMLANLVLSGSPFGVQQQRQQQQHHVAGGSSGPTTPTHTHAPLPHTASARSSLDTHAFSVISPPSSPQASGEVNGAVARQASACGLFHPHDGRRFWTRIWLGLYSGAAVDKRRHARIGEGWWDGGPLDGEEGELVDDEGCFVDASDTVGFDLLSMLPYEIALEVFEHLDLAGILMCMAVSRNWRALALDVQVWRDLYLRQAGWRVNVPLVSQQQQAGGRYVVPATPSSSSRRISLSFSLPSIAGSSRRYSTISSTPTVARRRLELLPEEHVAMPLYLDWMGLFKARRELERRWRDVAFKPKVTKLEGHTDGVYCLEFDSRYNVLVTGSRDRTIKVWELATGALVQTFRGHSGSDAVIRVWSRQTLELHGELRGHEGPVNAVGLQGDRLVSASGDGKMIMWDLGRMQAVRVFVGHDRGLACVEFQGDYIVSGSNDRKIKIWCAATGECIHTLVAHDLLVRALAFDVQLGRLVSTSYDRTVKVWDLELGGEEVGVKLVREFKGYHSSLVFDVKFDAGRIVSSSHDEKAVILDFGSELDTARFVV